MLILAQCFTASQFIIEEKLFSGYYIDPLFAVGCEGMFGLVYWAILLPIFQQIPCTTDGVCGDDGKVEDSTKAFKELGEHYQLLLLSFGIIVSIAAFNATGQAVTKYASAAQRSTVDTCRTLFVWIFQLILRQETFNWPQLFAFFLLVGGTLIYNEIVIVPIDFMRYNTKEERKKRDQGKLDDYKEGLQDPSSYVHSSPAASYDQGRNLR